MSNGGEQFPHRRQPTHMCQIRLRLVQMFLRLSERGHIHEGAYVVQFASIRDGARNNVKILYRSIWHDDSTLELQILFLSDAAVKPLAHPIDIIGVNAREQPLHTQLAGWLEPMDPIGLLRPE